MFSFDLEGITLYFVEMETKALLVEQSYLVVKFGSYNTYSNHSFLILNTVVEIVLYVHQIIFHDPFTQAHRKLYLPVL